ncbi:uncharacterized protein SPSK_04726 [Sporothrix schenckii 1099-18]|uniref:Uncharacterized protein n=1 Tax=Sporothrix schenckii 1099-18 TaxID=1397361 RepID=A0A0F2M0F3_SPOSC|nr:uncharacterized protein SPSK_04726 [Sporothrix schenckii 1099-18]KJR83182.1 hypothetical protein SPSK_04726 [Sporothrix schenckii 1099-18]
MFGLHRIAEGLASAAITVLYPLRTWDGLPPGVRPSARTFPVVPRGRQGILHRHWGPRAGCIATFESHTSVHIASRTSFLPVRFGLRSLNQ